MSQRDFPISDSTGASEAARDGQHDPQVLGAPGSPIPTQQPGGLGAAVPPPPCASGSHLGIGGLLKPLTREAGVYLDAGEGGPAPWQGSGGNTIPAPWGHALLPQSDLQHRGPLLHGPAAPEDEVPAFGGRPLMRRPMPATGEGAPSLGPPAAPTEVEALPHWGTSMPVAPWGGVPPASSPVAAASPVSASSSMGLPEGSHLQHHQQQLLGGEGPQGRRPGPAPASSVPGVAYDVAEGKWQVKWSQGGRFYTKSFPVSRFGFARAQSLAEGYRGPSEGLLNPAGPSPDYTPSLMQEGLPHQPYLTQEGGLLHPHAAEAYLLPPDPDDLPFGGGPIEQPAAAEGPSDLSSEAPQQRDLPESGSRRDSAAAQRAAPRAAVAAQQQRMLHQQQRQQQQQQQQQQPFPQHLQEMQLQEGMGLVYPGAPQGAAGGPAFVSEGQQHQGTPWLAKSSVIGGGGPTMPWLGFPGVQGPMAGAGVGPQGASMTGANPAHWSAAGLGLTQQQLRGPLRLGAPGQRDLQRGPPDCLLSAAAAQQHALLAVKAFLLACEEPVAPPWKQIASWAPWLTGQQQGPPHAGLQGPRRAAAVKQQGEEAAAKEAAEAPGAAEAGPPGGPEEEVPRDTEDGGPHGPHVAARREASDEGPTKFESRKKRGGPAQTVAPAKKAPKGQRQAVGLDVLAAAQGKRRHNTPIYPAA